MDLSRRGTPYNSQPSDYATRRKHFAARINAMANFDLNKIPGNEFKHYLNAGNETSFLVMRLFTYAGRPDLTSYCGDNLPNSYHLCPVIYNDWATF
ncbi:MAG: hypothetical protein N2035_08925 [Chthoniobacterales bacterium]|nr:hypothetical protein [Chthoniobacterales bacterium]